MIAIWIAVGVVVVLLISVIVSYNRFVRQRNLVQESWRQVDVELKRRHDLIPNLIATVKGYAAHERSTFDSVTEARTSAQHAATVEQQAAAENALTAALGRLFAVAEAYPQLRASENFQQLQSELEETEDKIAVARQLYNDAVLAYDNARETVPTSLVAGMLRFEPKPYFEIDESSRAVPQTDFSAVPAPQDG